MIFKSKRKLNIFDKIVFVINIIFTVALLLSYLAPDTDPDHFSIIAILGFGYQVLLIINILFIVYWAIKCRAYFLISTLSILAGITILTANFGFHLSDFKNNKKAEKGAIRMMAYNVNGFLGIDKDEGKPVQNEILQVINERQPDILDIEEYAAKKSDSGIIARSLNKILSSGYYYYKSFDTSYWDSSGNAIFTKFPIIDSGAIASPGNYNIKAVFVDVKYQSKIIRIYCVHLAEVRIKIKEKRRYLNGGLSLNKTSFILNKLDSAFLLRSYQVSIIKKHMSACPYPYIVAGDFNDTPISFAVNKLSEGLKNAFIEKGSGLGTTYYCAFPKLHIDYILVSPQFNVISYQTVDKKLSDHKAIISDLKLN